MSIGWTRLRRAMVSTTSSSIVLCHRRTVAVPIVAVKAVGISARRAGSRRRAPCLVLRNGSTVEIKGGRSLFGPRSLESSQFGTNFAGHGAKELPRPERIARQVRAHLPLDLHVENASLTTTSGVTGHIRRVDQLPGAPLVQCRASEQRPPFGRRTGWAVRDHGILTISFNVSRAQDGSGHPFDVGQFALAMGAVVFTVCVLAAIGYFISVAGSRRWG